MVLKKCFRIFTAVLKVAKQRKRLDQETNQVEKGFESTLSLHTDKDAF